MDEHVDLFDIDNIPKAHTSTYDILVADRQITVDDQEQAPMGWSPQDLRRDLAKDVDFATFIVLKCQHGVDKPAPAIIAPLSKDVKLLWTLWEQYELVDDILYRTTGARHNQARYVVPAHRRTHVLTYLHCNTVAGHFGVYRTTAAAVRRFYWPRMRADIHRFIKSCLRCELAKSGPRRQRAPLRQDISGARNERIAFDIIGPMKPSRSGNVYILTVGDYFTKYFLAIPLKRHTADVIAQTIITEWICKLGGCPLTIHTDQAPEFRSVLLNHLWEVLHIHHTKTLPFRPQSDGFVERFNQTIQQMLKLALGPDKDRWDEILPYLTMAYNVTEQASTGCSPNLLTFGEELAMPVDLLYGNKVDHRPWIRADGSTHYHQAVEEKRSTMVAAFTAARQVLQQAAVRQAHSYNVHSSPRSFNVGEWVLYWYKPVAT